MSILGGGNYAQGDVYGRFNGSQMILRDHLATDRTFLANQTTFLAYLRTALTLFVAGVTFARFFENLIIEIIGWIFMPLGIATFFVGFVRYNQLRVALEKIRRKGKSEK